MPKLFVFVISFLYLWPSFAQKDSTAITLDTQELTLVEISEDHLTEYRNNSDYDYELEKVDNSWWEAIKNWGYNLLRSFFEWLFGVDAAPNYIASFLKYVPYLLLGLLLFLLIRFLIKVNSKNIIFSKGNENLVVLSEEERIIKTEDIQMLIKKALDGKEYRLAIRYYYLFLLKLLTERELIDWQLQKTNDDYLAELSNPKLKPLFKKATLLYDYIWYGEFPIDAKGYEKAKTSFDNLKKQMVADV